MAKRKTLKTTKETVFKVNYNDLDAFVRDIYKVDYDFVAVQECGNDSQHEFKTTGELQPTDREVWKRFLKQGFIPVYRNNFVFNMMVADGLIKKGTYIVSVSW